MKNKIALVGILMAILAVFAVSSAAAYDAEVYFVPSKSSGLYCEDVYVECWVNSSVRSGGYGIHIAFDPSCVNVTNVDFTGSPYSEDTGWHNWGTFVRTSGDIPDGGDIDPGTYFLFNMTLHCVNEGGCVSDLDFDEFWSEFYDKWGDPWNTLWTTGTFACNKSLPVGWNLVSRPDITADNSTASVLAGVYYDAVYRYDANSDTFVDVSEGTMEPGVGYFVHVAAPSNWTYTGTPYKQMNISLKPGLNMIGWLDCTKDITDALSSIEGKYWYVARWNATTQEYETYNPVAPPPFNDFDTLEPTTGYWISMKESGWLNVSC